MNVVTRGLLAVAGIFAAIGCGQDPAASPGADAASGPVTRFTVGPGPSPVTLADFNRDGRLDLLVGTQGDGQARVFFGDGRGGFALAPRSPFPAGPMPSDFALADFDADGRMDLAVANHETSDVTVFLGDGSGGFGAARSVFTGSRPHVHSVAAADLSGDGSVDLVVESADTDSVQVVFGDGQAGFSSPAAFFVGDLPYFRVRAGDLDGDGRSDVAVALSREGRVAVLRSVGRGGLAPLAGSPYAAGGQNPFNVAIGDLNADRRADLAVVHAAGVSILLGDGVGLVPADHSPFRAGTNPGEMATGDVNGDGILDLAVANYDSADVTLFLSGATGPATTTRTVRVGRQPGQVALGDLDQDGRADLVAANHLDDDVSVWLSR
jgi:hypothetical protein